MYELFLFDRNVIDTLPKDERSKYQALLKCACIPNGRPYFLGQDGLPDRELDGFCEYLLSPQRGSAKTWQSYARQISVFLRYMEAQGKSWKEASRGDLQTYFLVRTTGEFQFGPTLKKRSWNVAAASIVHLYEYAVDSGLIGSVPFKYRKSKGRFGGKSTVAADLGVKFTPERINFIGIHQYKTIWRSYLLTRDNAQRNLALVDFLITVGLRIAEALALKVDQIPDPDAPAFAGRKSVTLRIVGKGNKARHVLVPKRIVRAIRFYIEDGREEAVRAFQATHGYKKQVVENVFLSERGSKLSARSVQHFFEQASDATGIRLSPHGCRHTFAVYQLEAMIKRMATNLKQLREGGGDAYRQVLNDPLRQLQLLLGHSQITSTYEYLDFLEESEALVDESLADWTEWEARRGG